MAAPQNEGAYLSNWNPLGGKVRWINVPLGYQTYRCTLVFKNLTYGSTVLLVIPPTRMISATDMEFSFYWDFRGSEWRFIGSPTQVGASACEAIAPFGSELGLFPGNSGRDFRAYVRTIYIPLIIYLAKETK